MPLGKMNMFGNQQAPPSQNQNFQQPLFQQPAGAGYGGGNYTPTLLRGMQKLMPAAGGQGGFLRPPGLGQFLNGLGGNPGNMPGNPGMHSPNPNWGVGPQSAGGQGYAAPGYPPQNFGQQVPQPMQLLQGYPSQVNPSQGYPLQGYAPQGYNQGYGGQMPVQPAWEEPKKGGIKGFISNLMARRKK